MADAVNVRYLYAGKRRHIVHCTNISDGTGESAVAKVDISTLTCANGILVPTYTAIDQIDFAINGFTSVRVLFDHSTDDLAAVLPTGVGTIDWWATGGLVDPRSSGGTGDLLFTTSGGASGSTYDITLWLRCKV